MKTSRSLSIYIASSFCNVHAVHFLCAALEERSHMFCTQTYTRADLVIYLGPAGHDAAAEVGMASVVGIPVFGLAGWLEQPAQIVAKAVTQWVKDVEELMAAVERFAEMGGIGEGCTVRKCAQCGKGEAIYFGRRGTLCLACERGRGHA